MLFRSVGHAVGNTGAGAAIGVGVGALSGAAIGSGMDEVEARNRAMIEQQMQRPLAQGATTVEEVVAMTRAGVAEDLIANHVRANGLARPLAAADLIYLGQQNVSPNVIRAMQEPRQVQAAPVVMQPAGPPPVVVEEYYYQTPYWYPPPPPYHYCRPRPRVGVGFSVHN